MKYIIKINNLTKKYGKYTVLDNLNMAVPKSCIYGLIGKNGAGKTTLIKIIDALINFDKGTIYINDIPNTNTSFYQEKRKISIVLDTPHLYQDMTSYENLKLQYILSGTPYNIDINSFLTLVNLPLNDKRSVKNYSLGMKKRLSIAMSLITNPDILILDEPTNGLDPEGIIDMRETLINLNKNKDITIIIASHYLDELSKIANYYGIIDKGRIIKEISSKDLDRIKKKIITIVVKDTSITTTYLDKEKIEYEVIDNNTINIYGNHSIIEIINKLKNIEILSIKETSSTLENYFLSLVGGSK